MELYELFDYLSLIYFVSCLCNYLFFWWTTMRFSTVFLRKAKVHKTEFHLNSLITAEVCQSGMLSHYSPVVTIVQRWFVIHHNVSIYRTERSPKRNSGSIIAKVIVQEINFLLGLVNEIELEVDVFIWIFVQMRSIRCCGKTSRENVLNKQLDEPFRAAW